MVKFISTILIFYLFVDLALSDKICESQKSIIDKIYKSNPPISSFNFKNESKKYIQLTWIGENNGRMLILMNGEGVGAVVYLSVNNGKNFTNITSKISNSPLKVPNGGLLRNPYHNDQIFIISYKKRGAILFYTEDLGETWKSSELNFRPINIISFHPKFKNKMLVMSWSFELYLSVDAGKSWKQILKNVKQYQWTQNPNNNNEIIATTTKLYRNQLLMFIVNVFGGSMTYNIQKSSNNGKTWKMIQKNIYGFFMAEKFLYVSVLKEKFKRRLLVSTDYGEKFRRVYLPTIMRHQFYSILDVEGDMVFVHVDDEINKYSGKGTLYTSDSDGRIFSQSLKSHFYPRAPLQDYRSEFYRVRSMRGTYITGQLNTDGSVSTLITFNKGAEWRRINKPPDAPCHDPNKTECYLQIAGLFSKMSNVKTFLPISSPTAVGIIMAHGHLGSNMKKNDPDVFVSNDGGYNWFKALTGPHQYQIADHGGLLVALDHKKNLLKFSTDEGRCWHSLEYTKDDIEVKNVLTEVGNKAMTVAIWGLKTKDKLWMVYVMDLSLLLQRDCGPSDYKEWSPHSTMVHPSGSKYYGCLLGKKEVIMRLKKDSLCRNGYSHEVKKKETSCPCTKDDYECEYGYYRPVNSMECQRNMMITENLCVNKTIEKIITEGYKKIPADECTGGFKPDKTKQKLLKGKCKELSENWKKLPSNQQKLKSENPVTPAASSHVIAISIGTFLAILLIGLVVFIFISRWRIIKQRHSNLRYKILSGIRGNSNNEDDTALLSEEVSYESLSNRQQQQQQHLKVNVDDSDVEIINCRIP